MPSQLRADFEELWNRIRTGPGLRDTGDDPVYYLVFPPEEMLAVKRLLPEWAARLENEGWTLETFSMAAAVQSIFEANPFRDMWLESEASRSFDADSLGQINQTLGEVLQAENGLKERLLMKLDALRSRSHTVLMLIDLEALHPYLRINAIEQQLQGRYSVPAVVLYPGTTLGTHTRRFLGIYPPDGSYRSPHIGD